MSEQQDSFLTTFWTENLDEVDHEIARLATLCQVRILDQKVITAVLQNDASVCGTHNPAAFARLRGLLMMHLAIREKSANMLGQGQTAAIEDYIIERLSKSHPDLLGKWPPA
jgi:hypothetical protein